MLKILRYLYPVFSLFALFIVGCSGESSPTEESPISEEELVEKALEIHDRILTVDTHADTPLRMIEPGFDMAEKHDPNETGSKVDYPRMKEGGLDAIFFAAFVAQDIRDDDGNTRAKELCLQMIDSIQVSTQKNAEIVGLALNPDDAYDPGKSG